MRYLHKTLIVVNIIMWISGTCLASDLQAIGQGDETQQMHNEKDIYISLPIFIGSLIATVGLTWTVAKYDNRRASDIQKLHDKLDSVIANCNKHFPQEH